ETRGAREEAARQPVDDHDGRRAEERGEPAADEVKGGPVELRDGGELPERREGARRAAHQVVAEIEHGERVHVEARPVEEVGIRVAPEEAEREQRGQVLIGAALRVRETEVEAPEAHGGRQRNQHDQETAQLASGEPAAGMRDAFVSIALGQRSAVLPCRPPAGNCGAGCAAPSAPRRPPAPAWPLIPPDAGRCRGCSGTPRTASSTGGTCSPISPAGALLWRPTARYAPGRSPSHAGCPPSDRRS